MSLCTFFSPSSSPRSGVCAAIAADIGLAVRADTVAAEMTAAVVTTGTVTAEMAAISAVTLEEKEVTSNAAS